MIVSLQIDSLGSIGIWHRFLIFMIPDGMGVFQTLLLTYKNCYKYIEVQSPDLLTRLDHFDGYRQLVCVITVVHQ